MKIYTVEVNVENVKFGERKEAGKDVPREFWEISAEMET